MLSLEKFGISAQNIKNPPTSQSSKGFWIRWVNAWSLSNFLWRSYHHKFWLSTIL